MFLRLALLGLVLAGCAAKPSVSLNQAMLLTESWVMICQLEGYNAYFYRSADFVVIYCTRGGAQKGSDLTR